MGSVTQFVRGMDWWGLLTLLISAAAALLCITLHELSHGFVAWRLGDPTAKNAGRLTLNPIKHLDLMGLLMMVVVGFGWAKPVPVNMWKFKNPKKGMAITAAAGPLANLLIAFVSISLVVSSIMIGVITYISVLERKKEIGILRAIGASKRNVSQVFNAETFIIGFCAGLMGIVITLLLLTPGNQIIHSIAGRTDINAVLPAGAAVVLIVLSILLTLLGGLIPSKKAAKSDPVTALRTE